MLLKRSMLKPHKAQASALEISLQQQSPPWGHRCTWINFKGTKAAHRWRTQSNTDAALVYSLHYFNGSKSFISVLTGFRNFSRGPQNSTTKRTTRDYSKKNSYCRKSAQMDCKSFVDAGTAMLYTYRCKMQRPPPPIPVPESHFVSGLKPLL